MSAKTKYFQNCLGVFQGGGCKGAAFVGAYKHARSRGVFFSEVVGASAGSIVAVMVAAGATPDKLESIIRDLNFNKFLQPPKEIPDISNYKWLNKISFAIPKNMKPLSSVITKLGIYDSGYIEDFVEKHLKDILGLNRTVKFKDLYIPCSIISSDLKTYQAKIWSSRSTPEEDVAMAVRASSNIPFFFQPINKRYVDGGMLSNLPVFLVSKRETTYDRILAFTLESDLEENDILNIKDYLSSLVNTTLTGNLSIQLSLINKIHYLNIDTGKVKATDFDKINKETIDDLIKRGENAALAFFNNEYNSIFSNNDRSDVLYDYFDTYSLITQYTNSHVSEIIISDVNTKWVYELFPMIMKWKSYGARLKVLLKENNDDPEHGEYRIRFLTELGAQVEIIKELPLNGILFDCSNRDNAKSIVFNPSTANRKSYDAKYYFGEEDFQVNQLLREKLITSFSNELPVMKPKYTEEGLDPLFESLKNVVQYKNAQFSFQEIEISNLTFITKFIRGFKYRQITYLFEIYQNHAIELFRPIRCELLNGKHTLMCPPIIEKNGSKYFVVEGNTRLAYLYHSGALSTKAVIVEGVDEELPSSGRYTVKEIIVSDKEVVGQDRYDNFDYSKFRKIEKAVRDPKTCLL